MAASDARPIPRKNTAYRLTFPIFDADGDLVTGAAGLDSEVSKDAGTFADCTNEATEIATSSGMYYLDLTSTEMNADTVAVIVKTSTSGAKTTPIVLYPEEVGDVRIDPQTVWDALTSALTTVGSIGKRIVDYLTGDVYARLGAPAGASIAADIAALPTDADVNAACDTALSDYDAPTKAELDSGLAALNDLSSAEVNAACDTALSDYDAPTKAELDSGLAALNDPTAAAVASAVLSAASSNPIHANLKEVNDVEIDGAGVSGDSWVPA